MLRKTTEDEYLRNEEKRNLEATLEELQTNLELMDSERGPMNKKIVELLIEVEFLKTNESEYKATLVCMEDEKQALIAESACNEERLQSLLTKIATMENKMNSFDQQRIELIEEHKVTEHFLRQQNEILQEEVDRTGRLLDAQNQRVEELETALHSVNKVLDSKKVQPLQIRSQEIENGKSGSNCFIENGKPKPNRPLEKVKPKENYVHEMVTFFNSKGT